MEPQDFAGQVAVVTGAARGLGQALAALLAGRGARVFMVDCDGEGVLLAADAVAAQGGRVHAVAADVTSESALADLRRTIVVEAEGRLDILVNNAGTPATSAPIDFKDLAQMTEAFWSAIIETNLLGPFRCAHAAAPALKAAKGAIVSTASVAGLGAVGSSIAYGASKAALINMTRNLARALAPEVRVNAVAPGLVDSPWTKAWPEEKKRGIVEKTLMARMCTPADIAEAMLFLATAAMVTGQTLAVDGGMSW